MTGMALFLPALTACVLRAQATTPFADFEERVNAYMKIHKGVEADIGRLSPTTSAAQLDATKNGLGDGIRAQRSSAKQGDIFTAPIAAEFRSVLAQMLKRRPIRIRESLRSGEQVMGKVKINGSYPDGVPLQTMPPTLLTSLPMLPAQMDYRFIGTTLVLRDVQANLIIDWLPNAIAAK